MPDRKAIERGLLFEKEVADLLGGKTQPGSGNKFYAKNDVIANGLSISCKSQKRFLFQEVIRYLNQSVDDSQGIGNIPVLALNDECNLKEDIIVMRISDFVKAFSDEIKIENGEESKGLEKRKKVDIPLMLRNI